MVVVTGDLTNDGFRQEYLLAKSYIDRLECPDLLVIPGNHDSRNVGYVHFEELFGPRSCHFLKEGISIVGVDSTEPDLDYGTIGRRATAGSTRSSRSRPTCASSCCTTTCCPCRGRDGSATWSTTPATPSRCCSAAP